MANHNRQKKIALINDMTGFGRCSIAVELPIICAMKVQCCPLPTAVLSNHTGYAHFFFDDYTDRMRPFMQEWERLGLTFDGICTGFLGSAAQIDIVKEFLNRFKTADTVAVVDPVMGDAGKLYSTYTDEACSRMKALVGYADILTPNLTEACILTETDYHDHWRQKELTALAEALSAMGPEKIVITGIQQGSCVANFCYERNGSNYFVRTQKVGTQRCGTGDIFASIIAADAVNGVDFHKSVRKASAFIKKCILKSIEMDIPLTDGVCFEEFLTTLR